MLCENCLKDIPIGDTYYRFDSTESAFCCKECITDYMFYKNMISIETNTGEEQEETA